MPSSIASIKVVEAVGKHTGTVIFLHGLGDQGTSFVPLANLLGRSFPNLKFILPSAKEMPITMNSGYTMPAWFDIPRLSDLSNPEASMRDDEPNLLQSLQTIQNLITNEIKEHQIPEQSIVLGGFSQGSVISLLTGIAGERKLGGVVALSGWVPLSHKIAEMAAPHAKDLAVFWGHGTDDQVVGYKFGLKSIELIQSVPQINLPMAPSDKKFQKPGLVFRKYKGMGHALCSEEIDDLTAWLKGITFDVWTSSHRENLAKGQQGTGDVQGHSTIPGSSHVMSHPISS